MHALKNVYIIFR